MKNYSKDIAKWIVLPLVIVLVVAVPFITAHIPSIDWTTVCIAVFSAVGAAVVGGEMSRRAAIAGAEAEAAKRKETENEERRRRVFYLALRVAPIFDEFALENISPHRYRGYSLSTYFRISDLEFPTLPSDIDWRDIDSPLLETTFAIIDEFQNLKRYIAFCLDEDGNVRKEAGIRVDLYEKSYEYAIKLAMISNELRRYGGVKFNYSRTAEHVLGLARARHRKNWEKKVAERIGEVE